MKWKAFNIINQTYFYISLFLNIITIFERWILKGEFWEQRKVYSKYLRSIVDPEFLENRL